MPRERFTGPIHSFACMAVGSGVGLGFLLPTFPVLANGSDKSVSSNQSGDCPARSAMKTPKAKPQSLPRQRDPAMRDHALIEADLVDTAMRDSAILQSEATPQVLSEAKNNMVALPGQLFYSTQIPVCLWFSGRNDPAGKCRVVSELELALAA